MNAETQILPPAGQELDPIEAAHKDPESALLNPEKRAAFLAKVREVSKIENPDVSTSKGRDEIRSMAMKVTRVRTMMDTARKGATEDLRRRVNEINAAGKEVIEELLVIGDEVRAPLNAWEDAEKEREKRADELLTFLRSAAIVSIDDTSATVRERGKKAYEVEVTKELFAARYNEAVSVKQTTVDTLKSALTRLTQQEAEQAELEALRQEKLAREEQERKDREAREAVEAKRNYARSILEHIRQCTLGMIGGRTYPYVILIRELEEKIPAGESELGDLAEEVENARVAALDIVRKAQQEQTEREQREAAERVREKAEAEAQAEAQREIDAANERAAQAERDAEIARQRLADEQAERERVEQAERDAAAAREKNAKHRREVMGQIKVDLIEAAGITEAQAVAAVKALVGGKVRHVQVNF